MAACLCDEHDVDAANQPSSGLAAQDAGVCHVRSHQRGGAGGVGGHTRALQQRWASRVQRALRLQTRPQPGRRASAPAARTYTTRARPGRTARGPRRHSRWSLPGQPAPGRHPSTLQRPRMMLACCWRVCHESRRTIVHHTRSLTGVHAADVDAHRGDGSGGSLCGQQLCAVLQEHAGLGVQAQRLAAGGRGLGTSRQRMHGHTQRSRCALRGPCPPGAEPEGSRVKGRQSLQPAREAHVRALRAALRAVACIHCPTVRRHGRLDVGAR